MHALANLAARLPADTPVGGTETPPAVSSAPHLPALSWRLLRTPPAPGDFNMAVDEAIMESVRSGGAPTLRLYGWCPPCLSLGRNQPGQGVYDAALLKAAGIDVVRRPTGGRAVLHDREITYAVIAPARAFHSARRAYHTINQLLVAALEEVGTVARLHRATAGSSPLPSGEPCFAMPADGEIVSGGRKLVGSAQLCVDGILLQHGSLPLARSPLLDELPPGTAAALDGAPAYPQGGDTPSNRNRLISAIERRWSIDAGPLVLASLRDDEAERVESLRRRYRDEEWTWRR